MKSTLLAIDKSASSESNQVSSYPLGTENLLTFLENCQKITIILHIYLGAIIQY